MSEFDIIAIGCGPANLSLAALIDGTVGTKNLPTGYLCLERRPHFVWHPGQLFPQSRMLSEFTRDLVTPIDPRSPYSFLCYLKNKGRLIPYLNSGALLPTRTEFTDYMGWVASQLTSLRFGATVDSVVYDHASRRFVVKARIEGKLEQFRARHIVVGIGDEPYIPSGWDVEPLAPVIHVAHAMPLLTNACVKKIAIVGGGQSAAELVAFLTMFGSDGPEQVDWWFTDLRLTQLDTGHFTREFFSAAYATRRYDFDSATRQRLLTTEYAAEHGISPAILGELYERLYLARYFDQGLRVTLLPATKVTAVTSDGDGSARVCGTSWATGEVTFRNYDLVVACTGFRRRALSILSPLCEFGVQLSNAASLRSDYSLLWSGPSDQKIFLQSRASQSHGIGDTALSAAAERNAVILNAALGEEALELNPDNTLCWNNKNSAK